MTKSGIIQGLIIGALITITVFYVLFVLNLNKRVIETEAVVGRVVQYLTQQEQEAAQSPEVGVTE